MKVIGSEVILIVTKEGNSPYNKRPSESFIAIKTEQADFLGMSSKVYLRVFALGKDLASCQYRMIPYEWIASINGKSLEQPKTEWKILSSNGKNHYTVKLKDSGYVCNCPHYTYRKTECKHIKQVEHDQVL